MAEQTNNLVDRLIRILSKKGNDFFDYSEVGKIKVFPHSAEGENRTECNVFNYDPSNIKSFLDAYEEATISYAVERFMFIGVREMFSGAYK